MAAKLWPAFYPDILMIVPGCPNVVVDHHLRRSAIELCSRSKRLTTDMPAFNTVAGTPTYALVPGTGMETVQVMQAAIDGEPIDPVRRAEVARIDDWATDTDTPTRFLMSGDDETVRLWKTPNAEYAVELTLAVKPDLTATGIEKWFGDEYNTPIVSGALSSLLALPKREWTDGALSVYHADIFEKGVLKATADADKDGTGAALRTSRCGRF